MANDKITQFNTLNSNTVAGDDLMIIVDVSSGTSPTGETKNIQFSAVAESILENIDSTDLPFLIATASYSTYQAILDVDSKFADYLPIGYTASVDARFDALDSDDIENVSDVTGTTVTDALNNISSSLEDKLDINDVSSSAVFNQSVVLGDTVTDALNNLNAVYTAPTSPAGGLASRQSPTPVVNGQTVFPLAQEVLVPNTLVYLNGVILSANDYVLQSGSVTLNFPASDDDELLLIDYGTNASGSASASPTSIFSLSDVSETGFGGTAEGQYLGINSALNALEFKSVPTQSVSVDNTTITSSAGVLSVADGGVSFSKIQSIADNTILGNTSGTTTSPSEIPVLQSLTASVDHNTLATAQAIVDYVLSSTAQANSAIDLIYPVGSVYINATVDTSPSTLFGIGTWERFGKGRVLVSEGSHQDENGYWETFDSGSTGGEYSHILTTDELPSHNHGMVAQQSIGGYTDNGGAPDERSTEQTKFTENTGGDKPHNNIQPYITVYMWKRTS